ncbi:MAG: transcription-repair coupling factor, partial [Nitrospirae bacterium]
DILFMTVDGLYSDTYPMEELSKRLIEISRGGEYPRPEFVEALQRAGYRRVSEVTEPGGFSFRRWIIDVFPVGEDLPVRIEFFGDQVESIRSFEIETQVSGQQRDRVVLYPAIESTDTVPVFEHLKERTVFISLVPAEGLPEGIPAFYVHELRIEGKANMPVQGLQGLGLLRHERQSLGEIARAIKRLPSDERLLFVTLTRAQADRIRELLQEEGITFPFVELERLSDYQGRWAVTLGGLTEGLRLKGLVLVTSNDLFGKAPEFRSTEVSRLSRVLARLDEISPGDYVVHKKHGIGIFRGLKRLGTDGSTTEVVEIEYAGGIRIYIPVQNLSLLQKYRAEEGAVPRLDRPGSKNWERKKERIKRRIKELAERLVRLYAHREVVKGFAFSSETELHREFESFFPFELTPDQERTWQEVKRDMESPRPMDRLICGDVGFGKTEIAMRAAFKAVFDGKQVAVLVPTTLLCEQHYRTFTDRFAAFPIRIDYLSRFKTPKERRATLERLRLGEIDIIIGTHALLGKGVKFYDLGLLVVDEEHRFGVTHKERIKELRKKVDCLSLSATPIPRTLEMSLSGIREMSLIETPPEERLAVRGIVTVFNEDVIREAIERELKRGGQVFFVNNRIGELDSLKGMLKRLVPTLKILIAHGQMPERELEEVMHRFVNQEADLLLCTAIIGSGIDLPTVNTIIINRADRMGLADLYQLKGRVGRGAEQGWAYFLIPPVSSLTDEAKRRIRAIEELNHLGAGLSIAMRDLEIRGAGNLLGKEQSGHIHEIGLDLYMEMLNREVSALKGKPLEEEVEPSIDLNLPAFIPEEYIEDAAIRLGIYRKLGLSKGSEELESLKREITDRFGKPPEEVNTLFEVMGIKALAAKLGIKRIGEKHRRVVIDFDERTSPPLERVMELPSKTGIDELRFHTTGFSFSIDKKTGLIDAVKGVLEQLSD